MNDETNPESPQALMDELFGKLNVGKVAQNPTSVSRRATRASDVHVAVTEVPPTQRYQEPQEPIDLRDFGQPFTGRAQALPQEEVPGLSQSAPPPSPPHDTTSDRGDSGAGWNKRSWNSQLTLGVLVTLFCSACLYFIVTMIRPNYFDKSVLGEPSMMNSQQKPAKPKGPSRAMTETISSTPMTSTATNQPVQVNPAQQMDNITALPKLWHIPPRGTVLDKESYDMTDRRDGYILHGSYFKFTPHERGQQFMKMAASPDALFLIKHPDTEDSCSSSTAERYAEEKLGELGVSPPFAVVTEDKGCAKWFDRMQGQPIEVYIQSGEVTLYFETKPK